MNSIIKHFDKYLPLNEKEINALTNRLIEKNKASTIYFAGR